MRIAVIGCGLRTPLLIYGFARSGMTIEEIALYDVKRERAELMARLGREAAPESRIRLVPVTSVEKAVSGASFVINSVRVGEMKRRASDERIALEHGFAGQETTGPAGFAMAMRTIPVVLEQARAVERHAKDAWIINFTNPAGLITQAIAAHTGARVVGICDTPAELFFRIALALREPLDDVDCDYFGLNHLGWVRAVRVRGEDVTARLLASDEMLRSLYPVELFAPELIRGLGLIPTEYLFFYYNRVRALRNQQAVGATRGEELEEHNRQLFTQLKDHGRALDAYRAYLNRRNSNYLKLEGAGQSSHDSPDVDWNPFEGETGYHRIAVDSIRALSGDQPVRIVLNVPNRGTIADLADEDVVEVPCLVDRSGVRPVPVGRLPESVGGVVQSVKAYERLTIEAAVGKRMDRAVMALFTNPIVGDWMAARELVEAMLVRRG